MACVLADSKAPFDLLRAALGAGKAKEPAKGRSKRLGLAKAEGNVFGKGAHQRAAFSGGRKSQSALKRSMSQRCPLRTDVDVVDTAVEDDSAARCGERDEEAARVVPVHRRALDHVRLAADARQLVVGRLVGGVKASDKGDHALDLWVGLLRGEDRQGRLEVDAHRLLAEDVLRQTKPGNISEKTRSNISSATAYLAGLKGLDAHRRMHRCRRRNDDGLNLRVREHLLKRLVEPDEARCQLEPREALRTEQADARDALRELILGPLECGFERVADGDELGPRDVEGQLSVQRSPISSR